MALKVKAVEKLLKFTKDENELASTAIQITCIDRNGEVVKRVTSTDAGTVEDPEETTDNTDLTDNSNGNANDTNNSNEGGNGGSQSGYSQTGGNTGGEDENIDEGII